MLAQVSLTPAESKKLIAKAIANMDVVKRALVEGIVVLHPSSSTFFIVEELTGEKPWTTMWVCGLISPKGACIGLGRAVIPEGRIRTSCPEEVNYSWVIQGGKLSTGMTLSELFDRMGPKDVYIKGVNAIDSEGNVGVLIGSEVEGGTIGRVIGASKRKGFAIIFPAGLEKLIPIRIEEAAKEALKTKYEYSMGLSCGLFPCKVGTAITELKAIEILSGAKAIPIAAGGLGGAEGAVTLVIKGETEQVTKAIGYVEQSKGARLPRTDTPICGDCGASNCKFPVKGKPWV